MGRKPKQTSSVGEGRKQTDAEAAAREMYRKKFEELRHAADAARERGQTLPGHKQAIDALIIEAKLAGVDMAAAADSRTEAQVAQEMLRMILDAPHEVMAPADRVLDNLLELMDEANRLCIDEVEARKMGFSSEEVGRLSALGKEWTARLLKVKKARLWARVAVDGRTSPRRRDGVEAAHTLRFMLYVGRTQTSDLGYAGTDLFRIGPHHALMATEYWIARNGVEFVGGQALKGRRPYEGLILVMAPGHGKPVHVDELVAMGDGSYKRLGDIRVCDSVMTHLGRPKTVLEVHEQGVIPTVVIKTSAGREIRACPTHPFLTTTGWKNAGDLTTADYLAAMRERSAPTFSRPDAECRLAGYFVGDGSTGPSSNGKSLNATITCADDAVSRKIHECADAMGFSVRLRADKRSTAIAHEFRANTSRPRAWLRAVGLAGKTSHTKRVPEFVFRSDNRAVSEFLAAYFECDGSVNKRSGKRKDCCCEFYSINRGLLEDVQRLLLRLGVASRLSLKTGMYGSEKHSSWRLSITSEDAVAAFHAAVDLVGPKRDRMDEWSPKRSTFPSRYIPDRVESVDVGPDGECRCLTVEDDHTFTANDCVVHNTEYGSHVTMLQVAEHENTQGIMLHSKRDRAQKVLQYVADSFNPANPSGRRMKALFPHVQLADKDNTATSMRLRTKKLLKEPTLISHGVGAAASGSNASFVYIDDPVDQREAHQPATREHVKKRIHGTWLTRRRGSESFTLWIATLWHEDDATADMISMVRKNKADFRVALRGCGGPNEDFKPVWEESAYTRAYLRRMYQKIGPQAYMTIYGCRPTSETTAIVESVALYAATSPDGMPIEQHETFLKTARGCITIDPAATVKQNSDQSGIVHVAVGSLTTDIEVNERPAVQRIPRMRVLHGSRVKATPLAVVEDLELYCQRHKIDEVHIETASGFYAMADMIETVIQVPIVRHATNPLRSKEVRLRSVSMMLDNSRRAKGMAPTVEFPGKWKDPVSHCPDHAESGYVIENHTALCPICRRQFNTLEPDDGIEWLIDEVVRFGGAVSDHGLDALTQICEHYSSHLESGSASVQVQGAAAATGFAARLSGFFASRRRGDPQSDYAEAENRLHISTYQ